MTDFLKGPSAPYVVPFAAFLVLLALAPQVPVPQNIEFAARCVILAAVLWYFSREVISFRVSRPVGSLLLGIGVFLIWIGPDVLFTGYRSHWLFQNGLTGKLSSSISPAAQGDWVALTFRAIRAVILVPIIEELFWRAWALRWIVNHDFRQLPLGSYNPQSFWIVAALFAVEHGPYWEVGLICGVLWNWWMGRTKSLGDLIFVHAVTNGLLCAYVYITRHWEYM
jgi:CAAX prenyl protease-like protein